MASILERPIVDFREFHERYTAYHVALEGGAVSLELRAAYPRALARIAGVAVVQVKAGFDLAVPKGYAIASGPGPRGVDHSCVALDGEIIHDPHPSRDGVKFIEAYEVLIPVIWEEE